MAPCVPVPSVHWSGNHPDEKVYKISKMASCIMFDAEGLLQFSTAVATPKKLFTYARMINTQHTPKNEYSSGMHTLLQTEYNAWRHNCTYACNKKCLEKITRKTAVTSITRNDRYLNFRMEMYCTETVLNHFITSQDCLYDATKEGYESTVLPKNLFLSCVWNSEDPSQWCSWPSYRILLQSLVDVQR